MIENTVKFIEVVYHETKNCNLQHVIIAQIFKLSTPSESTCISLHIPKFVVLKLVKIACTSTNQNYIITKFLNMIGYQ